MRSPGSLSEASLKICEVPDRKSQVSEELCGSEWGVGRGVSESQGV